MTRERKQRRKSTPRDDESGAPAQTRMPREDRPDIDTQLGRTAGSYKAGTKGFQPKKSR